MNSLGKTLLVLAVGLAAGMLLFKFGCTSDDEVRRVIDENRRSREIIDSLLVENDRALARLDSLRQADQRNQVVIDSLNQIVSTRERGIIETVESLDVYTGTPTDLLRELNEFVRSPLPPLPDTSGIR